MTFLSKLFQPAPRNSDIDALLRKLIDRFFIIFVITGTLSLAGSLVRVLQFGWMFQQIIHTAVYCAFILGFLIRNHFSVPVISLILFSLAGIDAVANLATFGLASTGTLMLGYVIIMMATFIGFGTGIIAMIVCVALLTGFGIAISSGVIPMNFDETRYVTSLTAWITQISTFIVMMATAVVATSGIKARLLASLHDLEHKKNDLQRSNQNLMNSERKIRTVIETAPEAITTTDLNATITSSNQATLQLLNYSDAAELTGRFYGDLIAPDDREKTIAVMTRTLDQGLVRDIEYNLLSKTGKPVPVKMAVSLLRNEDDRPAGFLIITQDMSLAKELEQHHLQAEKLEAIGQLAGGIAHDFNNQLTGIIGFAEMLRLNLAGQSEHQNDIHGILHTAGRASVLINQLLAFARKGKQQSISFDLHLVITEVTQILERTIDKNITITCNLAAEHSMSSGDPTQIQNAILNLALNARDAMPDGGTLTFATSFSEKLPPVVAEPKSAVHSSGGYIALKVSDTGCGIDEKIQKKIFEPFFTTKEPGKGTGMGLASVYGTVKNHNGTITVTSQPGRGTTMTLYLPHEAGVCAKAAPAGSVGVSAPAAANILLVDDEKMVVEVTGELLKTRGYTVAIRTNGHDAVEYFREHRQAVDLVILDMVMPRMSGKAACAALKQIDPAVCVLLYSGHDPHGYAHEIARDCTLDFIAKPYRLEDFFEKIDRLLKRSRSLVRPAV